MTCLLWKTMKDSYSLEICYDPEDLNDEGPLSLVSLTQSKAGPVVY